MLQTFLRATGGQSTLPGTSKHGIRPRWLMLLFGLMLMASFVRAQSQTVFVNELIYDSQQLVGNTIQEVVPNLIEIAGPANTNVNSWSLVFYERIQNVNGNINQGQVYGSVALSGTIPDQENGYGVLSYTFTPGTLNRNQSGIAVVNGSGEVTNFICYEVTSLTAVGGPAAGLVARQTTTHGATNGTNSIQLQGTGSIYTDFTWSGLFEKTPGQVNKAFINNKQVFVQPTFVNISVNPTTVTEGTTSNTAVITVTATRPVVGNQSVRVRGSGTVTPSDFGFSLITIPIASGSTSGTALLTISNDDDIEGAETLILTIDNPSESVSIGPTNTVTVTVLDNDAPPALTASPTTLNFSTSQGTASPEQSYVLSATALTSVLEARAPSGYQISKTSTTGFTNVVTFPNSTTSATVYVRIAANAPVGTVNGTIVNFSGSQTANVGVTGTVSSTVPANQAPVAVSNPNQTATVGVNFTYTVNAFTDPNGDVLTYSAAGLPAGLSFDAGTRTISGVASASGVSTVTITATDPGSLSANTTFTITVNPVPVTPPTNQAPVAVSNNNQTATVGQNFNYTVNAFTDPNGDALTYSASGLPAGLGFDANSRTISGVASASGVSTVTVMATDPGNLSASTTFTITVNPAEVINPPTPGSFAITGVTTVNCATVTAGLRTLTFTPQYSGRNGQPVTFEVVNESLPTTASGPYRLNLYTDNPTVTLKASQSGTAGESSFSYNWLATCAGGSTPPPTPTPGSFAITGVTTVNCATVSATQRTLTFSPQYSGTNGQPVTFEVLNESLPTTASGPYTLNLYTDNPTVTLKATQSGTASEASFAYNWLAACGNGSARKGAESGTSLQIRVLGNPVQNVVEVEVTSAQGTALTLSLTDMQNRTVGQSRSEQAGAVERHRFNVSAHPDGVLLLRVSTNSQTKTVRILKVQ